MSVFSQSQVSFRRAAAALSCAAALLAAGCGGSDNSPKAAAAPTASVSAKAGSFPQTVTAANGPVTVAAKPTRIVSLSATATEMLFAIGAGPQVKAVDDQSNYPAQAPRTKLSGFQPNLEAIAAYSPDLVIASNDIKGLVAGLRKLKLPVLLAPAAATVKDSYTQIEQLGVLTGHVADAARVVATMQTDLAAAIKKAPKRPGTTVYHELGPDLYSANSRTFIGSLYKQLGLVNIADKAPKRAGDYPKLSAEFVLSADPDLILLADTKCCRQSAKTVAARPGWSKLAAVRTGNVVALDDDVASRWGPRIVGLVEAVASRLAKEPAPAGTG
jgi:iron complex transport system substrate-binding protein